MLRALLVWCGLLVLASGIQADDREKAEKLRQEIGELRAQLASKEAQLASLQPVKMVEYLKLNDLKVNEAGMFSYNDPRFNSPTIVPLKVLRIVDKERAILGVLDTRGRMADQKVLISRFKTADLAEGKVLETPLLVRVLGVEKLDGRTFAHVEPYSPPKK